MEKYGKAAPQGRRIFHFRAKNALLPPSALPKKEKRRRMRDGVIAYSVQNSSITPLTA